MRLTSPFSFLALLACLPQPTQAQDIGQAQTLFERSDYVGSLRIAEPLCRGGDKDSCMLVTKLLVEKAKPTFNLPRFVEISTAACQTPTGAPMCGDVALVASGLAEGLPPYTDWAAVAIPGKRGCALGDARSCHAMSQLLTHKASPARNLVASIPFGHKACEGDMLAGCFNLMIAVQELPDPALGQYADDYLLAFDRACRLGTTKACSEVPRARKMKERAVRYGAASAVHMLYVDNGIDQGNWGGAVIHALEESRAPAVIEYAVGRVAAAGKMTYVRQQDLPAIARMLGNSSAAQSARNEMTRRSGLAATPSPARPAADNSSSSYTNPGATGARSGYSRCTASNGKQGKRYWYYGFDNKVTYGACI
ncbi:MAG: hypothetical protein U0S50_12005 [Sphingopyxis sp.]|nr:hypothetical protein [Sphingopyxis sp.]MDZ3832520.1 hypothetical protein [Sphingopyxis sp.]